jgi:lipopolysaccharide transport system ATP-binding protein
MITANDLTKVYHLYKTPKERLKEALSFSHKSFHTDFYALRNVSTRIKKGEIVGIVGNNGSGKSTFLKILTSVLTPTSGHVHVGGKVTALLELGSGFNPELSGMENLYLNATIAGFDAAAFERRIAQIVDFADIGEFIHQPLKTYSSGMKARLAFAFSIHLDPEILIIDEILSVGDASFQRKCFAKLEEYKAAGVTILFVSHSIAQIIELCDRAIWLHRGEKVLEGATKPVTALYQKHGAKKTLDKAAVLREYEKLLAPAPKRPEKAHALLRPDFRAKSVAYEPDGAVISDARIVDEAGREVNVLQKNGVYFFTYTVTFQAPFGHVNLATTLKTKTGLALGGQGEKNVLLNVREGERYTIGWRFKTILNPGIYFFNCGVNVIENGERRTLHRIIDAYMFEVQAEKNDKANNYVDFGFTLDIHPSPNA